MTLDETRQLVESEARLLGPRLFEGVSVAILEADSRSKGLGHAKYPHLRPMLVRAELREYLEAEGLPGEWRVDGNPALMGQLYLSKRESGLRLRVLKERRRTYPGGVPTAGRSPRRREHWQAPLIPLSAFANVGPARMNELLLLWDYAAATEENAEGFTLRVVHPTEVGVYGRPVRCDIDFAVLTGGTIFEQLVFQGDPEEEDLFAAEIDQAENDG
jgi:hypothetical protein